LYLKIVVPLVVFAHLLRNTVGGHGELSAFFLTCYQISGKMLRARVRRRAILMK